MKGPKRPSCRARRRLPNTSNAAPGAMRSPSTSRPRSTRCDLRAASTVAHRNLRSWTPSLRDAFTGFPRGKVHVVKEHQRRRVVKRATCRCRRCLHRTTPASLPAPYARSKVTCDWLAWFIHQKFALLSPLDRVRRDLEERGISLAMSTLVGFVERAATLLAPIDGLHWRRLLQGSWMATDGTGIKVLVPGLRAAHDGYIELYRNMECAVFQYEATKASDVVVSKLAPFHREVNQRHCAEHSRLMPNIASTLCTQRVA